MIIFGKKASEYFSFQKWIIVLVLVVGFARLGLSLAGVSNNIVQWISLTVMAFVGVFYCAVQVPREDFGTYKHLLPLYLVQASIGNLIIVFGIVLAAVS